VILNFFSDIKEDVEEECSKFGPLKHIFVDRNSLGFVYLKFAALDAAKKAVSALNHRWFAGKMITAEYVVPSVYDKLVDQSV